MFFFLSGSWPALLVQCFWPPVFGDGRFQCNPERAATDGCEIPPKRIGEGGMSHPINVHGIPEDKSS
ncbi:hypothetical protein DXU07_36420 [Bradyrhizobium elkanii]